MWGLVYSISYIWHIPNGYVGGHRVQWPFLYKDFTRWDNFYNETNMSIYLYLSYYFYSIISPLKSSLGLVWMQEYWKDTKMMHMHKNDLEFKIWRKNFHLFY